MCTKSLSVVLVDVVGEHSRYFGVVRLSKMSWGFVITSEIFIEMLNHKLTNFLNFRNFILFSKNQWTNKFKPRLSQGIFSDIPNIKMVKMDMKRKFVCKGSSFKIRNYFLWVSIPWRKLELKICVTIHSFVDTAMWFEFLKHENNFEKWTVNFLKISSSCIPLKIFLDTAMRGIFKSTYANCIVQFQDNF